MQHPVALVTGCASGIGARLGRTLQAEGYRLLVCDIDEEGLRRQFDASDQVVLHPFDVTNEDGWREALRQVQGKFGRLDYLFNVAGYVKPSHTFNMEISEARRHLEINTLGPIIGSHLAAQIMIEQGGGHIINIASLAGIAPIPGLTLYSSSKFALRGFSLAAAQELREHGVYVTAVCPDAVATPMYDKQIPFKEAALTFSGPRPLSVEEVVRAIMTKAVKKKALEVLIPGSRGLLARIASFAPWITFTVGGKLRKKGEQVRTKLAQTQNKSEEKIPSPNP